MVVPKAGQQSLSPRRAVQTLLQHIHEGSYGGGGEGVVVCFFFLTPLSRCGCETRLYSTALIYGDGSADHGDKHSGHVRKTVVDT